MSISTFVFSNWPIRQWTELLPSEWRLHFHESEEERVWEATLDLISSFKTTREGRIKARWRSAKVFLIMHVCICSIHSCKNAPPRLRHAGCFRSPSAQTQCLNPSIFTDPMHIFKKHFNTFLSNNLYVSMKVDYYLLYTHLHILTYTWRYKR